MKKSITYREITVAIGIVVALLVALTLWITDPVNQLSGFNSTPISALPTAALDMMENTLRILQDKASFK